MDMIWVMFTFFIVVTVVFIAFALAFPEWVGITGKRALEIQKHQQGDNAEQTDTTDSVVKKTES